MQLRQQERLAQTFEAVVTDGMITDTISARVVTDTMHCAQLEAELKACQAELTAAEQSRQLAQERRRLAEENRGQQDQLLHAAHASVTALQAEADKRKEEIKTLQREAYQIRGVLLLVPSRSLSSAGLRGLCSRPERSTRLRPHTVQGCMAASRV